MTGHAKIEEMRRRLDRKRNEYDEAKRVHVIVTADNWPDIKWWIETQMAKCCDVPVSPTDPIASAVLMGTWNGLRLLVQSAEKCQDLSGLELNLNTLQEQFQNQALGVR